MSAPGFEVVIGLEVHVQLDTETKIFCGCPNRFGGKPNAHVCPVCLGYPGALPVLDAAAVRSAVRAALAFDCTIDLLSTFDRKNYFYPDLPKGYQISQFHRPYATGGAVRFELAGDVRSVPLVRIHMEEDAGKSIHEGDGRTHIDLNRCGTPLLEMVTEPTITSAEEASAFLRSVRDTVRWIGVSDANMEEGSLRCDVNLSLRPAGTAELGTRTEVKNLNSFTFVEEAIAAERTRQEAVLGEGGTIVQETRLYDPDSGATASMRGKEEAHDYRYFPEPDLRPLEISPAVIAEERARLPEPAFDRRRRYVSELGLSAADAGALTGLRGVSDYFEGLLEAGAPPSASGHWVRGEVMRALNEARIPIERYPIEPAVLAELIAAAEEDRISVSAAREIAARAVAEGKDPRALLAERGDQVSDDAQLGEWIDAVLAENADAVERVRAGDAKPLGFLTGQVMQRSGGRANPKAVSALLRTRLVAE